jgi:hypothetical protein
MYCYDYAWSYRIEQGIRSQFPPFNGSREAKIVTSWLDIRSFDFKTPFVPNGRMKNQTNEMKTLHSA